MLSRRHAVLGGSSLIAALASGTLAAGRAVGASANMPATTRANRRVPYGACLNIVPLQRESEYRIALEAYCQQMTPEGGLLWADLRPTRDRFNFEVADKLLAFAEMNEMTVRGHTLAWYGAMPDWTKQIGSAAEAERELTNHIAKVVSRYRGRIKIWNVVNEPIDDAKGAVAGWRPSIWLSRLGVKYIDMAFRLAHEADPSAELVLNEYDIECAAEGFRARRQALLALVRDLLARGVPVHGLGLQGHIRGKYQIDDDGLYNFVTEIKSLGLSVHVTELDVIDNDLPEPPAVRDAIVAARAYDFLNPIFSAMVPSVIATWGITDRYTWMPMWFKRKDGSKNRPLPFDENYRPKPLWSVINYFCQKSA
jgi:endo-1,4-beta-xylanase